MNLPERIWTWLTEPLEERTALNVDQWYPDIDAQLYARQQAQAGNVPGVSIRDALGIPAVWRGVSLLSTVAGSLQLKEYRNELEIEASPVVRRPNKRWTPGSWTRQNVFFMSTRGETINVVRERDFQGFPSSMTPFAPEAFRAEWDGETLRNWTATDRQGKQIKYADEDIIHIPLLQDPESGRGIGPLQMCGIAFNVAQQADVWASRFFLGSIPSKYIDFVNGITKEEAIRLKDQWLEDPPNIPKVGSGIKIEDLGTDMEQAQAIQSRMHSRGDVAIALGIPGKMLEYATDGSSLTYQNIGDLATELVRLTLAPVYLEPIEQAFSDLRPRGTEVRYDVEGFQRADTKTRYEVHEKAIASGIYDAQYAQRAEGVTGVQSTEVVPTPLRRVS